MLKKNCSSIKFLIKVFIATLLVFMVMTKVYRIANNKINTTNYVYKYKHKHRFSYLSFNCD